MKDFYLIMVSKIEHGFMEEIRTLFYSSLVAVRLRMVPLNPLVMFFVYDSDKVDKKAENYRVLRFGEK